jgi:hypothetical protein
MLVKYGVLGFIAILFAAKWSGVPHVDSRALQGTWEIVSVDRSGVDDPTPVGYTLTFTRDEVHFQLPLDLPVKFKYYTRIEPVSEEQIGRLAMS